MNSPISIQNFNNKINCNFGPTGMTGQTIISGPTGQFDFGPTGQNPILGPTGQGIINRGESALTAKHFGIPTWAFILIVIVIVIVIIIIIAVIARRRK